MKLKTKVRAELLVWYNDLMPAIPDDYYIHLLHRIDMPNTRHQIYHPVVCSVNYAPYISINTENLNVSLSIINQEQVRLFAYVNQAYRTRKFPSMGNIFDGKHL